MDYEELEIAKRTLASQLRAARRYKGISQEDLAMDCEVERKTIYRFELRGDARLETFIKIADELGYTIKLIKKGE